MMYKLLLIFFTAAGFKIILKIDEILFQLLKFLFDQHYLLLAYTLKTIIESRNITIVVFQVVILCPIIHGRIRRRIQLTNGKCIIKKVFQCIIASIITQAPGIIIMAHNIIGLIIIISIIIDRITGKNTIVHGIIIRT